MSDVFEIYFNGLICLMCENGRYIRAEILWDEDLEHTPFLYLGPPQQKVVPITGDITFDLKEGGPPCLADPSSIPHLRDYLEPINASLKSDRPRVASAILPLTKSDVVASITLKDPATFKMPGHSDKQQAVDQLVMMSCDAPSPTVNVLIGGNPLGACRFVMIGNISHAHNPAMSNHFKKFMRMTNATDIYELDGLAPTVLNSSPGKYFPDITAFLGKIPKPLKASSIVSVGAPDCTITQWP